MTTGDDNNDSDNKYDDNHILVTRRCATRAWSPCTTPMWSRSARRTMSRFASWIKESFYFICFIYISWQDCYIEYDKAATENTLRVCTKQMVKECPGDSGGDIVCSTHHQSECWTKQHEHKYELKHEFKSCCF